MHRRWTCESRYNNYLQILRLILAKFNNSLSVDFVFLGRRHRCSSGDLAFIWTENELNNDQVLNLIRNLSISRFEYRFIASIVLVYRGLFGNWLLSTVVATTEQHSLCQNKSVCKELARSCEKHFFTKKAIYAPFAECPSVRKCYICD